MPKGPEPEGKATENGAYERFRCRKGQNQYLWKKLCNSAMQTVTTGTKKCEESVKKCGQ